MHTEDERDVVDIGREADNLQVFSEGEIKRLDQEKRVSFRWFKERMIVVLATMIISVILVVSVIAFFQENQNNRDFAHQVLLTLLGFAAGAIFTSRQHNGGDR